MAAMVVVVAGVRNVVVVADAAVPYMDHMMPHRAKTMKAVEAISVAVTDSAHPCAIVLGLERMQ